MPTFTVGEEVLLDDRRYVISDISDDAVPRYRLLATTETGARIVWARKEDLSKLANYTALKADTDTY